MNYKQIADFIINQVQDDSVNGFQRVVSVASIEKEFGEDIDTPDVRHIAEELDSREEVADLELDEDLNFDVVLYTDYAPNYQEH